MSYLLPLKVGMYLILSYDVIRQHAKKRVKGGCTMSGKLLEKLEVLNAAQGAQYCGLSQPSFRRELANIPHRRAGRRVLIRRVALDAWLEGKNND